MVVLKRDIGPLIQNIRKLGMVLLTIISTGLLNSNKHGPGLLLVLYLLYFLVIYWHVTNHTETTRITMIFHLCSGCYWTQFLLGGFNAVITDVVWGWGHLVTQ